MLTGSDAGSRGWPEAGCEKEFDELRQLADDPGRVLLLRRSLDVLAADRSRPVLRDFAEDVRHGRMGLAEAAFSSAYTEEFTTHVRGFLDWYARLSDDERAAQAAAGKAYLDALLEDDGLEEAS
ncbi:hypothetical protein ACWDWO_15510 [Actinopolymorpha singaporensis]|uniref:Uncharacterized protein n=1 Tax=Actinopolymorpha singaporensis TaxID=117157 RepID=A0A1H1SQD9_9ACTN|nr:hypothetical protein [Actinopolymorpha singaporensis]SDS50073.1 hypothetical protein SAMN04489717_2892 [Actinopolymorpha singaporensis]